MDGCTLADLEARVANVRTEYVAPSGDVAPSELIRVDTPVIADEARCLGAQVPPALTAEIEMMLAIQARLEGDSTRADEHRCAIGPGLSEVAGRWGLRAEPWVTAPCVSPPTHRPKALGLVGIAGGTVAVIGGSWLLVQAGRSASSWEGQLSDAEMRDWNSRLLPVRLAGVGLIGGGAGLVATGLRFTF